MTTARKLGIWMDHASAHLMEYSHPIQTRVVYSASTHEEKEKSLQKGETMMHNKEQQQQQAYYRELAAFILNYDDVLLFGPTDAKLELYNILKADKQFANTEINTQQADKMTENQEHAFVNEYFSKR